MKRVMIADGNWLLWRSYSVIGKQSSIPTVRVPQQVFDWFCSYAVKLGCDGGAICFDGPGNYRKDLYPDYKLSRGGEGSSSDEVYACLEPLRELFNAVGLAFIQKPKLEADDLLASGSRHFGKDLGIPTVLVAKDKDTHQNIRGNVKVFTPEMQKRPEEHWDLARLLAEKGFTPRQMLDYQILIGDGMDEVPPVGGVTPGLAKKLLAEHGTLKKFFETKEGLKFYNKNKDSLQRNRVLVGMKTDAWPVETKVEFKDLAKEVPKPYRDTHYRSLLNVQKNSGRSLF